MCRGILIGAAFTVAAAAVAVALLLRPPRGARRSEGRAPAPEPAAGRPTSQPLPETVSHGTPPPGDGVENPLPQRVAIATVRDVLDQSMAAAKGTYVAHEELATGPGAPPVASFVYAFGDAANAVDLDRLNAGTRDALHQRKQAEALMAKARERDDPALRRVAAERLVAADRQLVRTDRYAYLETATSTELPPVLMFQRGLPDWILFRETARELAAAALRDEAEVREVRRIGFGRVVFVCESASDRRVYVDANERKVYAHEAIVERPARRRTDPKAERARAESIRCQWEAFLREGVDITKFPLDKLEDPTKKRREQP